MYLPGLVLAWEIGSKWQTEVSEITHLLTLHLSACTTFWSRIYCPRPKPYYCLWVTEQDHSDDITDRPVRDYLHLPHSCEFPWTEIFRRHTALLGVNKAQTFDFEELGKEMQTFHFLFCLPLQVMLPV